MSRIRARAERDRQRQHAECECERRHNDRSQALLAREDRRFHDRFAFLAELHGGGHAQHRVFRAEADQHQKADLEVHVVLETAHPIRQQRAENAERHCGHHCAGQRPRLVLRREHEEHDDESENERRHGRSAGLLLLVGEPRPRERVTRWKHLTRDVLHRADRLSGAVTGCRVADDLRCGEAVEMRQQIRTGHPLRRDERRQRHHLSRR